MCFIKSIQHHDDSETHGMGFGWRAFNLFIIDRRTKPNDIEKITEYINTQLLGGMMS